jgi:protein-S-isoprenylcysteine O-methyltransferase Ste14
MAGQMSSVETQRGWERVSPPQLTIAAVIVVIVAVPLLTMATQFFGQLQRLATWSPLQLMSVFAGLLTLKVVVLLGLARMLRRNAE